MVNPCYKEWQRRFLHAPPLGWVVRSEYRDRWVRLYYLPEGKRYPADEMETEEIFRRLKIVSSLVGGVNEPICVFVPYKTYLGEFSGYRLEPIIKCGLSVVAEGVIDKDQSEISYDIYGISTSMNDAVIQKIFQYIQKDEIIQSVIMFKNGNVISPYDGGLDVFVNDQMAVTKLANRLHEWVSPRKDGL